jgi:nucleotide-binding universal stress UspA family protein
LKYNNILHQFIPVVDYDNLIAAVNQLAEKHKADLIVMGTKGASNVAKKIIGSNTMHVIQGCNTPVLAVPHDYNYKPIHKVAFTSNYENEYCNDDLKALVKLVEKNDYQIDVLHVLNSNTLTKEQEAVKASLYNCFKNTTHEFIELETDGFIKAVSGYVETNNIDLLAMVNRNIGFWDRLFSEQKVEKLAYNINVPLLVM